ncbi:MAG: glycosyltransferase family 39 protein [Candidatus Krumholzibacteria bacterium]|nr:glycosyltransferase family 39 protein [Candidatus Krumholzibacteria bacterium]
MNEHGGDAVPPSTRLVPPPGWLRDSVAPQQGCGAAYLLLVTALALMLRLWRLDAMSLWIDEIFTWDLVAPGRGLRFGEQILAAYQGPLYHAAVWPLLRLHESPFMLRLPAALAGVLAVPLLGLVAARLWDRPTGRLAALFLALSPFAVWYAQEARGYSFLILFTVATGWVLLDALARGVTTGKALALALLGFGGLTSNFAFLFLLAAFALTVLVSVRTRRRRDWLLWCLALGGGVVLALPWLLLAAGIWEVGRVLPGAATGEHLRGETTFSAWALPFTGYSLFYGFSLGPPLADLHGPGRLDAVRAHLPILVLGALVASVGLVPGLLRLDRRRWPLVLWIVVPLAAVVLLAMRNVKPFNVRYVATVLPWLLALAAAGVCRTGRRVRFLLGGALGLLMVFSLAGYYFDDRHAKEDVRGAVAAIIEAGGPSRPLLATSVAPVVRHYWRGAGEVIGLYGEPLVTTAADAADLVRRRVAGHEEIWVIWVRSWDQDPYQLLPGALAATGSLQRAYSGPQIAVDLWRRRAPEEGTP